MSIDYSKDHWFKYISELREIIIEPQEIEFLKVWTGETFIHTQGTTYFIYEDKTWDFDSMIKNGITHWRILASY